MTLNIRRIVTAHDADGKAIIGHDGVMTNLKKLLTGNTQTLLWVTDRETKSPIPGAEVTFWILPQPSVESLQEKKIMTDEQGLASLSGISFWQLGQRPLLVGHK